MFTTATETATTSACSTFTTIFKVIILFTLAVSRNFLCSCRQQQSTRRYAVRNIIYYAPTLTNVKCRIIRRQHSDLIIICQLVIRFTRPCDCTHIIVTRSSVVLRRTITVTMHHAATTQVYDIHKHICYSIPTMHCAH